MFMLNGKERTLQEFIEMGCVNNLVGNLIASLTIYTRTQSGFQFVKLWAAGEVGLLEFKLKN
jgi:hypothetical protein